MDDLMRLAELARIANPVARVRQSQRESKQESIVRCVCGTDAFDESGMIRCSECHCYLHAGCIEQKDGNEGSWICPFCDTRSAERLEARHVDLAVFHEYVRHGGCFQELVMSAKAVQDSQGFKQLFKAVDWLENVKSRNDVYSVIEGLATVSMPQSAAEGVAEELLSERTALDEVAEILGKIAGEGKNLETPLLDALAYQITTHVASHT